jgi:hypothetical protein
LAYRSLEAQRWLTVCGAAALLATALGLFPLTAPIAMPMRMSAAPIPTAQIVGSLVLVIAGLIGCGRPAVSGDHDLLVLRHPEIAREIIFDLRQSHLLQGAPLLRRARLALALGG